MRGKTEKEQLCVCGGVEGKEERYRERVVQGGEKGWGKRFPWEEKLSVPRRLQTRCSPVISLLPGSLLTAPWLRRLDSSYAHTYTRPLAAVRALNTHWLIHSYHNTFKFQWHTHTCWFSDFGCTSVTHWLWHVSLQITLNEFSCCKLVKDTLQWQTVAPELQAEWRQCGDDDLS